MDASHPARGGWIEIQCRSPFWRRPSSPTLRGVGGLKLLIPVDIVRPLLSHPARGGWIEIRFISMEKSPVYMVPPCEGGVD